MIPNKYTALMRNIVKRILKYFPSKNDAFIIKLSKMPTHLNEFSDIVHLDEANSIYYGEIPETHFYQLLNYIHEFKINASDAILEYCSATNNEYFLEHAIGNKRGLIAESFGDLRKKEVLDYGCGLGAIGIACVKKGANVTFVDSCQARVKMAKYLTEEFNTSSNSIFSTALDINSITKLKNQYDLIIINGLLEWLPSTKKASHTDALEVQRNFLRTCRTLLSQDGRIYIGMENRFALLYQIGHPEDHTNINRISIIDRRNGNRLHQLQNKTDYVNFTWTYEDYYNEAKKMNMEVEKIFGMFPDYRFPQKIIDLNNVAAQTLYDCMMLESEIFPDIGKYKEYINYLNTINVLKHFVYSFGVIIRKLPDA
jgi:2-polyprenyl-3-methyl-5-hydroxy-6-metoxy-1,4-benzoquinol methylase